MAKVSRKVIVRVAAIEAPDNYSQHTLDSREFTLPWGTDSRKVARLVERTVDDLRITVDDLHGPLPAEPPVELTPVE